MQCVGYNKGEGKKGENVFKMHLDIFVLGDQIYCAVEREVGF